MTAGGQSAVCTYDRSQSLSLSALCDVGERRDATEVIVPSQVLCFNPLTELVLTVCFLIL